MSWLDINALGRVINHDTRPEVAAFNPPRVEAPAMSDDQFAYDNQREIEVGFIANPHVMARLLMDLRERVTELEKKT